MHPYSVHDSSSRIDEVCGGHSAELLREGVCFSRQTPHGLIEMLSAFFEIRWRNVLALSAGSIS
jgi:hypothetical protein